MRYRLNPHLVKESVYRDPNFPFYEQAVFLRDPHVIPNGYEPGIGEIILDGVREDLELAREWNETGRLMDAVPEQPARIFRTRDCFGFSSEDEVLLIIWSHNEPMQPATS